MSARPFSFRAVPAPVWLLPIMALPLLWPLADAATNRAVFLAINGAGAKLPDVFWSDLTVLGDSLVVLCLALPFLRRWPDLVLAALLAGLFATLLSHGLKAALDMARPYAVLGDAVHVVGPALKAGSFPSGHTTSAFVLATVLAAGLRSRNTAMAVLLLAMLVGLARIGVGAHWPRDVVGGMLCGWLSGLLGLLLVPRCAVLDRPRARAGIRLLLVACALDLLFFFDSGYPLARPFEQALGLAVLVYHLLPGWSLTAADTR